MKRDLEQMLKAIAADFRSPAGAVPIERVLQALVASVEAFRSRGLTWEQIGRLLAGAGVCHADGRAFPASHLRGVFGRQRRKMTDGGVRISRAGLAAAKHRVRPAETNWPRLGSADAGDTASLGCCSLAGPLPGGFGLGFDAARHGDPRDADRPTHLDRSKRCDPEPADDDTGTLAGSNSPLDRERVLALMRQSAAARRR